MASEDGGAPEPKPEKGPGVAPRKKRSAPTLIGMAVAVPSADAAPATRTKSGTQPKAPARPPAAKPIPPPKGFPAPGRGLRRAKRSAPPPPPKPRAKTAPPAPKPAAAAPAPPAPSGDASPSPSSPSSPSLASPSSSSPSPGGESPATRLAHKATVELEPGEAERARAEALGRAAARSAFTDEPSAGAASATPASADEGALPRRSPSATGLPAVAPGASATESLVGVEEGLHASVEAGADASVDAVGADAEAQGASDLDVMAPELDALAGEPTSITEMPEGVGADEDVPTDNFDAPLPLAEEPTRPKVSSAEVGLAPTPPAQPAPLGLSPEPSTQPMPQGGPATQPSSGEFTVGPTVVVDPSALEEQQREVKAKIESGEVSLPPAPTQVTPRPEKKSSAGLIAGVAVGALLLLSGLGVAVYFLVFRTGDGGAGPVAVADAPSDGEDPTTDVAAPSGPVEVGDDPAAGSDPSGDTPEGDAPTGEGEALADAEGAGDPGADEPGADEPADDEPGDEEPDAEEPGAEGTDAEAAAPGDAEETAEAPTGAVDLETLEGAEADPPDTARRARRMTEAQRRRQSARLRGRALRRYRADAYTEAEALYREALTYNAWDVAAIEGVARSLAQQERYPLALAWANRALTRNPRSATAVRIVGDIYRQAGHPEQALRTYRRGLRRHPDDRWLRARVRELRAELR